MAGLIDDFRLDGPVYTVVILERPDNTRVSSYLKMCLKMVFFDIDNARFLARSLSNEYPTYKFAVNRQELVPEEAI